VLPSVDVAAVIAWLISAIAATRVLVIGEHDVNRLQVMAGALPADGLLICMQSDAGAAAAARAAFAAGGHASRASVMVGDPARFLHKLSGPFDLVVQDGAHDRAVSTHDRVTELVRHGGTLVTQNVAAGGRYNEQLAADQRLHTVTLAGVGIALSTRRHHGT
jgi:predicted O-methyltransferase YrrM